jgi:hypothetical protein
MRGGGFEGLYYIIYPAGDKTKLSVVYIQHELNYEIKDYARASHKEFKYEDEAKDYAKELAIKHNLAYISDDDEYLD